jgi:hypothetical protein
MDASASKPAVETWPIERLRPYERNSRRHSPEQIEANRGLNPAMGLDDTDPRGRRRHGFGRPRPLGWPVNFSE